MSAWPGRALTETKSSIPQAVIVRRYTSSICTTPYRTRTQQLMTSSLPDTDRVRTVYDQLAPVWDERQGFVERVLMGNTMRASLARHLRGEVLELGSGTGATFPWLDWSANGVTSLTATDLSAGMLDQARRHEPIAGKPVTFRQLEATQLPFESDSFDTVTTSLTLCTVPDPAMTLREMSRVTRPNGRVVILEHVRAPNRIIARLQTWLSPWQQRHMGCHLDRATDTLVRDLGFVVDHQQSRFLSIFQLLVLRPLDRSSA